MTKISEVFNSESVIHVVWTNKETLEASFYTHIGSIEINSEEGACRFIILNDMDSDDKIQVVVFASEEGIWYKADYYEDLDAEFPLELFSNDEHLLLIIDDENEFICFHIS
jgi:hypothetical protein